MKLKKLFMALLAAFLLAMPAFSMPDAGKQQMSPNDQPFLGDADKLMQPCDGQGPNAAVGPNEKVCPSSMMDGALQGPAKMGKNGKPENKDICGPKSMMDGKQPGPFCELQQSPCDGKAFHGLADNAAPRSMMDGKFPMPGPHGEMSPVH
jgi:hypothetical protein